MGCWNATCNLTNVSISSNEEVVGIIVKLNMVSGNACYINTHGSPKYLPVIGKYNDYGSIEDIKEDFNTKLICDDINALLKDENVEKRFDDYCYKGEDLDIEDMITLVERGLNIDGQEYGLSIVVKSIYDKMTETMENNVNAYLDYKTGVKDPQIAMNAVREITKSAKYKELLVDNNDDLTASQIEELKTMNTEITTILMESLETSGDDDKNIRMNPVEWTLGRNSNFTNGMYNYKLDNELGEEGRELLGRFCSYAMLLSSTRKTWCNTSGMGSQDDNYETISKLSKVTKQYTDKIIKEREEW